MLVNIKVRLLFIYINTKAETEGGLPALPAYVLEANFVPLAIYLFLDVIFP